jgi:hypothetical protein
MAVHSRGPVSPARVHLLPWGLHPVCLLGRGTGRALSHHVLPSLRQAHHRRGRLLQHAAGAYTGSWHTRRPSTSLLLHLGLQHGVERERVVAKRCPRGLLGGPRLLENELVVVDCHRCRFGAHPSMPEISVC